MIKPIALIKGFLLGVMIIKMGYRLNDWQFWVWMLLSAIIVNL